MTGARQRLTGRIAVDLPPAGAFRLFTPRGEEDWVPGWQPRFPAPAADDSEPGTVFETSAHGEHTLWIVTGRQRGRRMSYARVTPGDRAGTVTVTVRPAGRGSEVAVSYELTALSPTAAPALAAFAEGYAAYLQSWQEAVSAWLHGRHRAAGHPGG